MKMMESSTKWSMNRDEQRQVKHDKRALISQTLGRTKVSREKALVDSKDRQQFKREVKSVAHNEHLRRVKVCR